MKEITFEVPVRINIDFVDKNYNLLDGKISYNADDFYDVIKHEAEADWNNSDMASYYAEDASDTAININGMTMEIIKKGKRVYALLHCYTEDDEADVDELMIEDLKEFLEGQMSDGWGEGFEQRAIKYLDYEKREITNPNNDNEYQISYIPAKVAVYVQFWWHNIASLPQNVWYIKQV